MKTAPVHRGGSRKQLPSGGLQKPLTDPNGRAAQPRDCEAPDDPGTDAFIGRRYRDGVVGRTDAKLARRRARRRDLDNPDGLMAVAGRNDPVDARIGVARDKELYRVVRDGLRHLQPPIGRFLQSRVRTYSNGHLRRRSLTGKIRSSH